MTSLLGAKEWPIVDDRVDVAVRQFVTISRSKLGRKDTSLL